MRSFIKLAAAAVTAAHMASPVHAITEDINKPNTQRLRSGVSSYPLPRPQIVLPVPDPFVPREKTNLTTACHFIFDPSPVVRLLNSTEPLAVAYAVNQTLFALAENLDKNPQCREGRIFSAGNYLTQVGGYVRKPDQLLYNIDASGLQLSIQPRFSRPNWYISGTLRARFSTTAP